MKKGTPITYQHLGWLIIVLICMFVLFSAVLKWVDWLTESKSRGLAETSTENRSRCNEYPLNDPRSNCNFILGNNGYSGCQMGCNYAKGSNADWNEQTHQYGNQMYLSCANGLDYVRIEVSGK